VLLRADSRFPPGGTTLTGLDDRGPAPRRPGLLTIAEVGLVPLGLLGMAFLVPHGISGDGEHRYQELVELLHGHVSADSYSMVMPLFSLPFWLAGAVVGGPRAWLAQFNLVLFAMTLVVVYALLRGRVDGALLRRFLLLLTAGTMIAAHVTDFYGEVFTASCVAVGLIAAVVARRGVPGWVAVVVGAVNTPASIVGLGLVGLERAVTRRRLRYLAVVAAGAALVMAEAWIRRGGPLESGHEPGRVPGSVLPYQGPTGFTYPFVLGVFAILLSFGKGLVYFVPGLLLPVRRRLADQPDLYRVHLLWMHFLAGLVLVYASWWAWYGGMYWGPRFFLIAIFPASLALAVALTHRHPSVLADVGALAVLALSTWVGASSSVFQRTLPSLCYDGTMPERERFCFYAPELSQLWYPLIGHTDLGPVQVAHLCYYGAVFVVLAAPVVARVARRLRALPRPDPREWRW
jgi:hypothetical protein